MAQDCGGGSCEAGECTGTVARQTGDEESTTVQRLFQQLYLSLRGNEALLNNSNLVGVDPYDVTW